MPIIFQSINEDSLKKLNQHIQHLHTQPRHVTPLNLVFYLRDASPCGGLGGSLDSSHIELTEKPALHWSLWFTVTFRPVRMRLDSLCIRETVTKVLQLSELPLEYVKSLAPPTASPNKPDRPIKWSRSFAQAFNDHIPTSAQSIRKVSDSTLKWVFLMCIPVFFFLWSLIMLSFLWY